MDCSNTNDTDANSLEQASGSKKGHTAKWGPSSGMRIMAWDGMAPGMSRPEINVRIISGFKYIYKYNEIGSTIRRKNHGNKPM